MGRQFKITQARLNCLQKAANTKKATVKNVSDEEDNKYFSLACNTPPDCCLKGFLSMTRQMTMRATKTQTFKMKKHTAGVILP
jgi:hypothetical protein